MKIVFLEANTLGSDVDLSGFSKYGEVIKYPLSDKEENAKRVREADIVVVNKIQVGKELLSEADHVKLVCISATGTNNVDFDYCNARGIAVKNVRSYSTWSVAQHTFALLFYVYEKLSYYDQFVKSGEYCKNDVFSHFTEHFSELKDKTWGVIGLGEIGRKVADIAKSFGCKVQYYSTSGKNIVPEYNPVDFDKLLKTSDIISIHAPLNKDTKNLINATAISKMKRSAVLLNLGRGQIVDEEALSNALLNDQILAAGLDVLSEEPMRADNPLLKVTDSKKLIITPHIAWATREARQRCVDQMLKNVEEFLADWAAQ